MKKQVLSKCEHCGYWSPEQRPCKHCGAPLPEANYDLDYDDPVIVPCEHCGQWGAVFIECKSCGAPVNPSNYLYPSPRPNDAYWLDSSEYWMDGGVSSGQCAPSPYSEWNLSSPGRK